MMRSRVFVNLFVILLLVVACQPEESTETPMEVTRVVEVSEPIEVTREVEVTRIVEVSEQIEVTRIVEVTVPPEPASEGAAGVLEESAFIHHWARTEAWNYTSELNRRDYRIYVALPRSYAYGDQQYPVIYVTDGDVLTMPLAAPVSVLSQWENYPEVIVVGIGYGGPRPSTERRQQDFGGQPERESFLWFILEELIPNIEANYRVDPTTRGLMGHSDGGAFAIYAMFNAPETFGYIVANSPSSYPKGSADPEALPVRLFLSVGNEGDMDEQFMPRVREFHEEIEAAGYEGLETKLLVLTSETHWTSPFRAFVTGFKWLFEDYE